MSATCMHYKGLDLDYDTALKQTNELHITFNLKWIGYIVVMVATLDSDG